jgi:phosphoenolpyruvate synthase/pyruvate phosphate dikinase
LADAEKFWLKREKKEAMSLLLNVRDSSLVNLKKASLSDVDLIGGKAANFAELMKVDGINTPEGSFAIPFYFYDQHLKKYGLDLYINKMLHDIDFYANIDVKIRYLKTLRDSIIHSPIDTVLVQRIIALYASKNMGNSIRFRSSTNAEDIDGFNGAGLYDSYTGKVGSTKKPIDLAIKKVWASLWNVEAVEERAFFRINQEKVAMAILAHRTFPNEDVNGVLITSNQYTENLPAYIINVQQGDVPVVSNEKGSYTADEIILFNFGVSPDKDYAIQYVAHSNLPDMADTSVMSEQELYNLKVAVDKIFAHYCTLYGTCRALDIEFKLDSSGEEKRKLYIKQVRLY